jgi:ATP-binding cassette subfamily B protein
MRGRTSFVIAQRISTVRNADLILVLDRGRVAAHGTHDDLMENSSIYAEIFASQLVEDAPADERAPHATGGTRPVFDDDGREGLAEASRSAARSSASIR